MTDRDAFLAGEAPEDVAFFLHEDAVGDPGALAEYAESVPDGLLLIVPGDDGREAFQSATGIDPMALAREAMGTEGTVDRDLTGGTCPAAGASGEGDGADGDDHRTNVVFAFVEEQNEEVGGIYAEGDVVHAYGVCSCGERYADKWVIGD